MRKSLVLLKNDGVLPLKPKARILVAGTAADSISQQSGGWSISWQGNDVPNAAFPNAQSIWSGIAETVQAAGGVASYAPDGRFSEKPDVAIVVFGEQPYAEFMGDIPDLEYSPDDKSDLAMLRRLQAAGIPTVTIFLSGRPLWVNAELNASNAFVAAFLPGSEGGGIADMLFADAEGAPRYDFHGKLSFSWPKRPDQYRLNRRDPGYDPLFAFGYGLRYAHSGDVAMLDESRPAGLTASNPGPLLDKGKTPAGWSIATRGVLQSAVDRHAQEDSRRFAWTGAGTLAFTSPRPFDLGAETEAGKSLAIDFRVDRAPRGRVLIAMGAVEQDVTAMFRTSPPGSWSQLKIALNSFAKAGADMRQLEIPLSVRSSAPFIVTISDVRIE